MYKEYSYIRDTNKQVKGLIKKDLCRLFVQITIIFKHICSLTKGLVLVFFLFFI